jgi:hypothetical protein
MREPRHKSPPEIMTFAINGEEDPIEVSFVAKFGTPAAGLIGMGLRKLSIPRA